MREDDETYVGAIILAMLAIAVVLVIVAGIKFKIPMSDYQRLNAVELRLDALELDDG